MIEELITGNLGYCCLYAFFRKYRATTQIALRLGVSPRTIRTYKARYKEGEYTCARCSNCLKKKLF